MDGSVTYRKDLYYINTKHDNGYWSEKVVSAWYWWIVKLFCWNYYSFKEVRVLRSKDRTIKSRWYLNDFNCLVFGQKESSHGTK